MSQSVNELIEEYAYKLGHNVVSYKDVPEEIASNIDFIRFLRTNKLSKTVNKGYDVIRDVFFANEVYYAKSSYFNETIERQVEHCFDSFSKLYFFIDGQSIYQNACYYQCTEERLQLDDLPFEDRKKIKLNKLLINCSNSAFTKETINKYTPISDAERSTRFSQGKENQQELLRLIDTLYSKLDSYKDFINIYESFQKTSLYAKETEMFVVSSLMQRDINSRFLALYYKHQAKGDHIISQTIEYMFWSKYSSDDILKHYKCHKDYSVSIKRKNKKIMMSFLNDIKTQSPKIKRKWFNAEINKYCIQYEFTKLRRGFKYEYFDDFKDFVIACDNDLSDVDLRDALELDADIKYITNWNTQPPIKANTLQVIVDKEFVKHKNSDDGNFVVKINITDSSKDETQNTEITFRYLFDFLAFLDKDLSNANLILCDGLINLRNIDDINFEHARMQSRCAKKFGLSFVPNPYKTNKYKNKKAEENELQTLAVLQQTRDELAVGNENDLIYQQSISTTSEKVYYIPDIHLLQQISNHHCESYDDVEHLLITIAQNICPLRTETLIIAGDISSNFDLYKQFVKILKEHCDAKNIFFVLGNHELWSSPGVDIDHTSTYYKTLLQENGMHLLHNNIFVCGDNNKWTEITKECLSKYSTEELDQIIAHPRLVLFGGTGFAGFNDSFNADYGLYSNSIDRNQEVIETTKFNDLYEKVLPILQRYNSIVATHMPKEDWSGNQHYENGIVYVSGHTHKNFFYDDNETRIYADNQIGYKQCHVASKYFYIDTTYDWFSKYSDGIHEITQEDYNNFYRGKNIRMACTREMNVIYMLKKNSYYCFIHKNKSGGLAIFSGGALKGLARKDINYYYDNMQLMINTINEPLTQYSNIQRQISRVIKQLGGSGRIHGCIIDIDFFNHVYINPSNGAVRAYYAEDIIRKVIYPSIPQLLEENCPDSHQNYLKLIESGQPNNLLVLRTDMMEQPVLYLNTDIYSASRIIKKMQKIESQILTYWDEAALENHKTKMNDQQLLQENDTGLIE